MTDYAETLKVIEEETQPQAPTTNYSETLKAIEEQPIGTPQLFPVQPPESESVDYAQRVYTESNLVEDDYFYPIQEYMIDRFGVHMKEYSREDLVEKFTNNMRGFAGGNSIRAVNEITYLNELGKDEERLLKAGKAYTIYENLQPMFGETTFGEKAEIAGDFFRSAVLDPVNVLSLGVGKVVSGVGFRGGSQLVMIAAKQAYKKELLKGATKEAAQEVAEGVFKAQSAALAAKTTQQMVQRQAVQDAAKTYLQRMTTSIAIKEGIVTGVMEGAVSAGTDYLYQDAMLRTKVQDEYNIYQTGLAAVAGLVAGGLSGMMANAGTGGSKLVMPTGVEVKTTTRGSTALGKLVNQEITTTGAAGMPSPVEGSWLGDIAKGRELKDQDTEFFLTMLLGNDEKGLKGLAQILVEEGYVWKRRSPDDLVSNWVGDVIKDADPQDAQKFLDDFTKATGIDMVEGKSLTIEEFANTFKKKMSDSGKVLNAASQVAKILGKNPKEITVKDIAEYTLTGAIPEVSSKVESGLAEAGKKVGKTVSNLINRDLPDFQNNIIRLIVSNLSTTGLNVTGFSAATALNSASDIVRAALLGGTSGLYMVYNPAKAKQLGISAYSILQNQITKAKNTLDPNTTYEAFLKYSEARPEAMRPLTAVLPGGVESLDKIAKGIDLDKPLLTLKTEQVVDIIQRLNLVSAQDGYTKSIEFTSQLDKLLRRPKEEGGLGMSWNQFFSQPDHPAQMMTERYLRIEAMAVDETLKAVFSKSYKGKDFLGEVAGIIEDARNLPGIGLLVPFGRFFNNTIAMMYDSTAIGPLIAKSLGGQPTKMYSEIVSKGIVTWSLIGILAQREQEYIDMGLGWSEEVDESTGEVIDERYEFPYGAFKAMARIVAYYQKGDSPPPELITQLNDQFFGQLTRQLTEAGSGVSEIMKTLISGEGEEISKLLGEATGTIVSQAISGATRTLEPINTVVGLARDEEFYIPDRKQGTKWVNQSLRYMDQIIAGISGENLAPPVFSAAEGQPAVQASRIISTTRGSRLTNTERLLNSVGRAAYLENMASMSDVADNRYNEIFNQIVEESAGVLFESERFKKADLETKQLLVTQLFQKARKSTKDYMGRVATKTNDRALLKLLDISLYKKTTVENTLKDLGFDRDLDALSEEELDTLLNALKFREEILTGE